MLLVRAHKHNHRLPGRLHSILLSLAAKLRDQPQLHHSQFIFGYSEFTNIRSTNLQLFKYGAKRTHTIVSLQCELLGKWFRTPKRIDYLTLIEVMRGIPSYSISAQDEQIVGDDNLDVSMVIISR